jgi:hypothetical protein
MKQLIFHDDPPFWFETLRTLGLAAYGGSDVGEVIATASRVTPGDYDGWHDAWHDAWLSTAERNAWRPRHAEPDPALGLRPRPLRHEDLEQPRVPGRGRPLQLQGRERREPPAPCWSAR